MRRALVALALGSGVLLIGACGGGGSSPPAATGNGPVVTLRNLTFDPENVPVKAGETVTWKWGEKVAHNVTFPSFHSKTTASGPYTHTFSSAGTFSYRCTIHPTMTGKVIVTAS